MRYNERNDAGTGRSRSKGNSSRSGQASGRSGAGKSTGRSGSARGTVVRSNYQYKGGRNSKNNRRGSGRGRGGDGGFAKLAVGGVVLILAIACIVFLLKGINKGKAPETQTETEMEATAEPETELQKNVTVDGIDITGMSREKAKDAILKKFPWSMKVTWEDRSMDVADLMAGKVDALLDEIYSGEAKESYSLDTTGLDEAVKAEAARAAAQWDKKAKNGSISSYDAEKDKFIFSGSERGQAVDQEKLAADLLAAVNRKEFDASVAAVVKTVEPEFDEEAARSRYEKLSTFTTKTTSNKKRNTNIKLSAQALNGTVVQPGEEFSFNQTVGERTAAKGYQGAAAYNNGEVVEEIGGGVCQTSSTLYNAVVKAGLKTTVRRSHTYEPSYVTPGTDATVSWGGPDYKFVNNSSAGIGIRAHYADQTITISIYGIPVLEKGVSHSLKSEKVKDMDLTAPVYEEDPTLQPGVEKTKSAGSKGSRWETRLVVTKNGEVVSQEIDHSVTYKGHAPVVLRNTSGTVAATEAAETTAGGTIDPSESSPAPEGAGDGLHREETPDAPANGPESVRPSGGSTQKPESGTAAPTAPATQAPKPENPAPQPKPENPAPQQPDSPDKPLPPSGADQKPQTVVPAAPDGAPAPDAPADNQAPAGGGMPTIVPKP